MERGVNKVVCSRLIQTRFYFVFGLLFIFKLFAYIYCIKMLISSTFVSNDSLAQSVKRGANNGKVMFSGLIRTRFHFLFGLVSLF